MNPESGSSPNNDRRDYPNRVAEGTKVVAALMKGEQRHPLVSAEYPAKLILLSFGSANDSADSFGLEAFPD